MEFTVQRIRDIESPLSCMQNQAPGYFELKLCAVFYWKTVPFLCGPRRGKKLSASPGVVRVGLSGGAGAGCGALPSGLTEDGGQAAGRGGAARGHALLRRADG